MQVIQIDCLFSFLKLGFIITLVKGVFNFQFDKRKNTILSWMNKKCKKNNNST